MACGGRCEKDGLVERLSGAIREIHRLNKEAEEMSHRLTHAMAENPPQAFASDERVLRISGDLNAATEELKRVRAERDLAREGLSDMESQVISDSLKIKQLLNEIARLEAALSETRAEEEQLREKVFAWGRRNQHLEVEVRVWTARFVRLLHHLQSMRKALAHRSRTSSPTISAAQVSDAIADAVRENSHAAHDEYERLHGAIFAVRHILAREVSDREKIHLIHENLVENLHGSLDARINKSGLTNSQA